MTKKLCNKWKLNPYDDPETNQSIKEEDKRFKQLLKSCKSENITKEDCIFFEMTSINPLTNRRILSNKKISEIKEKCEALKKMKRDQQPVKPNICEKWIKSGLQVNPRTGRTIKSTGKVYKDLEKECKKELEEHKEEKKETSSYEDDSYEEYVEKKSNLFKGKTFYVMTGDRSYPKTKIEMDIKRHSGKVIQNPSKTVDYILSSMNKSVKITNWIDMSKAEKNPYGDLNIISYVWFYNSIIEKKILPFHPIYMIYTNKKTRKEFEDNLDDFGDSYTDKATIETLKKSMKQVKDNKYKPLSDVQLEQIIEKYGKLPNFFMRDIKIDFEDEDELKMLEARMYGAKITDKDPDFVFKEDKIKELDALEYGCKFNPKWCEKFKNKQATITKELVLKSEKKKELINQNYLLYY